MIYKCRGNLERAVQCFCEALRQRPTFPQALNNLGAVFTVQGRLTEAVECLKRAVVANADYAEAYNNLGVLYRDQGQWRKALQCFTRAIELSPDDSSLWINYFNQKASILFIYLFVSLLLSPLLLY